MAQDEPEVQANKTEHDSGKDKDMDRKKAA